MINTKIRTFFVSASILAATCFSGQAFASNCKGLENKACSGDAACSWVEGYERKDGRKVKSFCRAKPNFKAKSKSVSKAKSNAKSKVTSDPSALTAGR